MDIFVENKSKNDLLAEGTSWVKEHPKAFRYILRECNDRINKDFKKIYLIDVIASLSWRKKICVSIYKSDCISVYIINKFPVFKGRLESVKKEKRSKSYKNYLQFLQFARYMDT